MLLHLRIILYTYVQVLKVRSQQLAYLATLRVVTVLLKVVEDCPDVLADIVLLGLADCNRRVGQVSRGV